uniref:Thioredoxin-like 4, chloroplastic n=1 Tax=Davidia involucrata TaxID=16924 RepID=A0A5B7BW14_DAVIN
MQKQSILHKNAYFSFRRSTVGQLVPSMLSNSLPDRSLVKSGCLKAKITAITKIAGLDFMKTSCTFQFAEIRGVANENLGELTDEDDDICPVDCVREFRTDEEFFRILEKAKETNSLVVVDFYRTSCGSCKYIEQGFAKLCKGSGDQEAEVIFLKHNVIDEYDEQSEVAERLRIKAVPLFHFYKDGTLLEAFATRDKDRIDEAILKYTTASQDG